MALSSIISEKKRGISQKSRFSHIPLHLTPPVGGHNWSNAMPFGTKKTRMGPEGTGPVNNRNLILGTNAKSLLVL